MDGVGETPTDSTERNTTDFLLYHEQVTVREGRDRLLRQAFVQLGHPVKSVTRLGFGPIDLGGLRAGETRRVSLTEVARLTGMLAAAKKKVARKGRRGVGVGVEGKGGKKLLREKGKRDEGGEEEDGVEEKEVDEDIEAFWDAVEDEEDQEEDGVHEGDDF